ncbi:MAG: gamma-glutamyl-gamma-aminobutyrate hydrolase family protein [Clostridiaceae bacterium]|nr:gamma-glutamyl-gamma-aminobutyrate hydrolase family protein [Clostridiaceae bacterium]
MAVKPVIGITPSHDTAKDDLTMRPTYLRAIRDAGAIPLVFPLEVSDEDLDQLLSLVDGVLFTGGPDVHPSYFGEPTHLNCGDVSPLRDKLEIALLPKVLNAKKPVLGICRGIQLLNIGLGGTIYQDIPSQTAPEFPIAHRQPFYYTNYSHSVSVEKGSLLASICGSDTIQVNSMHHQAIKKTAPSLTVTGYAPDGLIEAVEMRDYPYFVAVQWHPEYLYPFNEAAKNLFTSFVDACRKS